MPGRRLHSAAARQTPQVGLPPTLGAGEGRSTHAVLRHYLPTCAVGLMEIVSTPLMDCLCNSAFCRALSLDSGLAASPGLPTRGFDGALPRALSLDSGLAASPGLPTRGFDGALPRALSLDSGLAASPGLPTRGFDGALPRALSLDSGLAANPGLPTRCFDGALPPALCLSWFSDLVRPVGVTRDLPGSSELRAFSLECFRLKLGPAREDSSLLHHVEYKVCAIWRGWGQSSKFTSTCRGYARVYHVTKSRCAPFRISL